MFQNADTFVRLRITPNCKYTIKELKNYKYKEWINKKVAFENDPQEKPQKKNDHACDALRYMIMTRPDLKPDSQLYGSEVDKIMEGLGYPVNRAHMEIADPRGILDDPNNPDNRIPSLEDGWSFDEHMGGLY